MENCNFCLGKGKRKLYEEKKCTKCYGQGKVKFQKIVEYDLGFFLPDIKYDYWSYTKICTRCCGHGHKLILIDCLNCTKKNKEVSININAYVYNFSNIALLQQ